MSEKKRRSPRQARAQASVEAILEAGFQILEHEGEGALNTNLIAQRAGVSIGTLYQYFSSKEETWPNWANDMRERYVIELQIF